MIAETEEKLKNLITELGMRVKTYSVVSDATHNFFREVTGNFAGNLFCDLIVANMHGVAETILQVIYDPQYDNSIVVKSGVQLSALFNYPEEIKKAWDKGVIRHITDVEETELEIIEFLKSRKPSTTRIPV